MNHMPTAYIERWYRDRSNEPYRQIALSVLGRALQLRGVNEIWIYDREGEATELQKDNSRFYIFIASQVHGHGGKGWDVPRQMWKQSVNVRERENTLLEPSGLGLVIAEPDNGYVVAELIGNNLFILFSVHSDSMRADSSHAIYRQILTEALVFLGGGIPSLTDIQAGSFKLPEKKVLKDIAEGSVKHREKLSLHATQLVELEEKQRKLGENNAEASLVLNRIYGIPEIKSLYVEEGAIHIRTHLMYGKHPTEKTTHEYGEFDLVLYFGEKANATFKNRTRRVVSVGGWGEEYTFGHPHVDRERGHWCQGEGEGIIKLLREFEFEAAVLFALKAIDSVNEDQGYLKILTKFPQVKARMDYPLKKESIDEDTVRAFGRMFSGTLEKTRKEFKRQIAEIKKRIAEDREQVIRSVFAEKLLGILYAPKSDNPHPSRQKKTKKERSKENEEVSHIPDVRETLAASFAGQIEALRKNGEIREVSVSDNTLRIVTLRLPSVDIATGRKYEFGPFTISFDFLTGATTIANARPISGRMYGPVYQAPHIPGEGELPSGQLVSTIPELMGNLDFETAAIMIIEFIKSFDSSLVDRPALELLKNAA
ncbi:MAG TPA: hypothetical protein VFT82_00400 [Candidatus Paceibacterota bacterium]|nr:hypothetical protein [Candidatus Paceibacterota bacterium]